MNHLFPLHKHACSKPTCSLVWADTGFNTVELIYTVISFHLANAKLEELYSTFFLNEATPITHKTVPS